MGHKDEVSQAEKQEKEKGRKRDTVLTETRYAIVHNHDA